MFTCCIYCELDMHFQCANGKCKCAESKTSLNLAIPKTGVSQVETIDSKAGETRGRKEKEENFHDAVSTGRKRAAKIYGHLVGQTCDWAFKKNCGGGIIPVTGCSGFPSTNIHHGPNKSVIQNDRNNISIICSNCHNLWHAKNNAYYIEPRPADGADWFPLKDRSLKIYTLEDIQDATAMEIFENEAALKRNSLPGLAEKLALEMK